VAVTLDAGADDGVAGERDDLRGLERIQTVAGGRYVGTDGADELLVGGEATTVEGRGGDDTIFTSYSADVIDGGAGADTIRGYGGADRITGGPGSDTLFGDTADHVGNALTCTIQSGNDVIDARDGERDDVDCGLGTDRALVDTLDVHVRCEDVQVGAPATGGVGGVAGGSADGASRPPSRLMVQRRPLRAALAHGLVVRLAGARPGRVPVTVRWGRRAVAAGVVKVGSDGRGRATVRFVRRLRPVLAAQRRLTLRVVAGRAVTVVRLSRR
jgi:Ca2+-binding RTX toxin-like protein